MTNLLLTNKAASIRVYVDCYLIFSYEVKPNKVDEKREYPENYGADLYRKRADPMTIIPITEILTIIFVLVDDWYQAEGRKYLRGKAGKKPEFKDSEIITLMLAHDFIPFPSETQYVGFIRANYLALFPKLVDQCQFNRRARVLRLLVEQFRRYLILQKGWCLGTHYLLDTKPIPVMVTNATKVVAILPAALVMGAVSAETSSISATNW